MRNIIQFIFYSFLFSSAFIIESEKEIETFDNLNQFLESTYSPIYIKNINLFDVGNYDFEFQSFEAPNKITLTTLNPLSREISLYESAHLLRRTIIGK